MGISTVLDGMGRTVNAPSGSVLKSMPAHYVAIRPTMLNPAQPSSSFLPIITPFVADAWEYELRWANIFEEFSDVPYSICHGFDLGIHSTPAYTHIPPNHASAIQHPLEIKAYINSEPLHSRYMGPFSLDCLETLIGPFQTSIRKH